MPISEADIIKVTADADKALSQHELQCERRYSQITTELTKLEALMQRNTKLLWLVIAGLLTVAGKTLWLGVFA